MEIKKSAATCSECGCDCGERDCFEVDGAQICHQCLFGDLSPVSIYPIGFVENDLSRDTSNFGTKGREGISRIRLLPSQKRFLYKLDEETHLTIVYYLHQSQQVRSRFNRGYDGKEVGVFASRTPYRLSRLAIQTVRLVRIEDTTLFVEDLDAVNGSPVLDIKMKWPV